MPAFVYVEIEIHDPELYETYKKLTPRTIEAFGGKFAVRGGETEVLEGNTSLKRRVLLQFPSVKNAREWWHSEEYSEARKIRQRAASTKMILMQGLSE